MVWAVECAEHVLPLFEARAKRDRRPRAALEAARAWTRGERSVAQLRVAAFAAHAAARAVGRHPAAVAAARAAGHAAATTHVATHAPHAATYAVDAATAHEREWQAARVPKRLARMRLIRRPR